MKLTKKLILIIVIILLLGLAVLLADPAPECGFNGNDLVKIFEGNMVNTVGNVKITMCNGTVVFDGCLPANNRIEVKGVWLRQTATIAWTDFEGSHVETVGPIIGGQIQDFGAFCYNSNVFTVTNKVNHTPILKPL